MIKVLRPGVFDLLHVGHINCIDHASSLGDWLIVGVHDDREVFKEKGRRPAHKLADRMHILHSLRKVNQVISYRDSNLSKLLKFLDINVLSVGEDYGQTPGQKATLDYCVDHKILVDFLPRTTGVSTSSIMDKIHRQVFWEERAKKRLPTTLTSFNGDRSKIANQTDIEVDLISKYIKPESCVLDLGCGDGRLTIPLSAKCKQIDAVDFSKVSIDYINDLDIKNVYAECANIYHIEHMTKNEYDVIIMSGLLPCLDDNQYKSILNNIAYLIKKEGYIIVRSTVGKDERIEVIRQYSESLNDLYTAYYRTAEEIKNSFAKYELVEFQELYSNHEDTELIFIVFQDRRTMP